MNKERVLHQTVWSRARRNVKGLWDQRWFQAAMWLAGILGGAAGSWLPDDLSGLGRVGFFAMFGLAGLFAVLSLAFLYFAFRAPLAQRDEAREEIRRLTNPEINLRLTPRIMNDDAYPGSVLVDVRVENRGPTSEFEATAWSVVGVMHPDYGMFPLQWELTTSPLRRIPKSRTWRIRLAHVHVTENTIMFRGPETPYGPATVYKPLEMKEPMNVRVEFDVRDVLRDEVKEFVAHIRDDKGEVGVKVTEVDPSDSGTPRTLQD